MTKVEDGGMDSRRVWTMNVLQSDFRRGRAESRDVFLYNRRKVTLNSSGRETVRANPSRRPVNNADCHGSGPCLNGLDELAGYKFGRHFCEIQTQ